MRRGPLTRGAAVVPALALAGLGVVVLVVFLVLPTYPNYDSYYSLLWGRELLHGEHLSFDAYRSPTEHPLAVFYGAALSLLGSGADRVMVFTSWASFVVLAAGLYRLGRLAFTPAVGLFAGLVLCTRFDFPFLAARGYIDVTYLALVVWAAALEAARPRRGTPVLVLLALASMMRPEAWVLAGLYFLWVAWKASWRDRALFAALTAVGPLVWVGLDLAVTGDPLFSQHHTSGLASELGRSRPLSEVPAASAQFLKNLTKVPVFYAGALGAAFALYRLPKRAAVPLAVAIAGEGTFLLVGAGGLSVIDRYLLAPSLMLMLFTGVSVVGWTMLEPTRLRTAWIAASVAVVALAGVVAVARTNFTALVDQFKYRGEAHVALEEVLSDPAVQRGLRCGPVSTPNHKLIPDVRWLTHGGVGDVVARADVFEKGVKGPDGKPVVDPRKVARFSRGGVAIYVNNRTALLRQALVDATDDPLDSVPLPGFVRVAANSYYGAYVRCPSASG